MITGASKKIGAAIAAAFGAAGANLVLVARTRGPLEALATDLRASGTTVEIFVGDVASPDFAERVTQHALDHFGSVTFWSTTPTASARSAWRSRPARTAGSAHWP